MVTLLLIVHSLLAVALLGALTHQAISVWWPATRRTGSFVSGLRSVPSMSYTNAIILLFCLTMIPGAIVYAEYRIVVRVMLQDYRMYVPEGAFELKEHLVAIGLGLLPFYWYLWKNARNAAYASARKWLTVVLAAICWYAFLTGHVVNNVRGFGS